MLTEDVVSHRPRIVQRRVRAEAGGDQLGVHDRQRFVRPTGPSSLDQLVGEDGDGVSGHDDLRSANRLRM
jgi:hypothetical protein